MKIKTTRFGEVEVDEKSIFKFVYPILGYENESEFAIVEHDEASNFKWLQSVNTPELAFVISFPGAWNIDYTFELPAMAEENLNIESVDDLIVMNIVVIPSGDPKKSTINLLAPLILNIKNRKAGQFVLSGSNFSVEQPLFGGNE